MTLQNSFVNIPEFSESLLYPDINSFFSQFGLGS